MTLTVSPVVFQQQSELATPQSLAHDPVIYISQVFDDNDKLEILQNKWSPPPGFSFPVTGGCKYNQQWEVEYPWLRYSVSKDAAFCVYCVIFGDKLTWRGINQTSFQVDGFNNWKNAKGLKSGALPCHNKSDIHKTAAVRALSPFWTLLLVILGTFSPPYQKQDKTKHSNFAANNRCGDRSWQM